MVASWELVGELLEVSALLASEQSGICEEFLCEFYSQPLAERLDCRKTALLHPLQAERSPFLSDS